MNDFSHMSHLQAEGCDLVRAGIEGLFGLDEVTDFERASASRCRETPVDVLSELAEAQKVSFPSLPAKRQRKVEGPSTLFLETVSASRFLSFAYWDLLERDVDKDGLVAFGDLDYSDVATRRRVINGILSSQEYMGRRKIAAPYDRSQAYRDWRDRLCPRVANGHTFESRFFAGLGGSLKKKPLIWRDTTNRNELFTAFGMTIRAEPRRGCLLVEPEWVFHGPKCPLKQGLYQLKLGMIAEASDLFHYDVVYEGGTRTLLERKFFGGQQGTDALDLPTDVADFEVRLFNLTGRQLEIELLELSLSVVD